MPTKIRVMERLGLWGEGADDGYCPSCREAFETLRHLLLLCPVSRAIWSESPWQINIVRFSTGTAVDWVKMICHPH